MILLICFDEDHTVSVSVIEEVSCILVDPPKIFALKLHVIAVFFPLSFRVVVVTVGWAKLEKKKRKTIADIARYTST